MDDFNGKRVTLWTVDKAPEKARFFIIRDNRDDATLRAEMAERLWGEVPTSLVLLTVDDVLVDDARYLRENDKVVLRLQVVHTLQAPSDQETALDSAPKGPRKVIVSFIINKLNHVDVLSHTVDLDFQMYLSWVDPELVGVPVEKRLPYDELWNPNVEINNDVDLEMLWALYPEQHQDVDRGLVRYGARYRGHISNRMDLHHFPFDADAFSIKVGPKNLTVQDCLLVMDDAKHGFEGAVGDTPKEVNLDEWDLLTTFFNVKESLPSGSGSIYSNAEFGGVIFRRVGYYFWKVLKMKMILIYSCFTCLFQDPLEDFADRQAHTFTLALTQVAFLYIVAQELPKVSYLTIMDRMMLVGFFVLFMVGVENWLVYIIVKEWEERDTAETIDRWCQFMLPSIYTLCMIAMIAHGMLHRNKLRKTTVPSKKSVSVVQVMPKE